MRLFAITNAGGRGRTHLCRKKVQFCYALARRKQAELSRNLATFLSLDSVRIIIHYLTVGENKKRHLEFSCPK